MTDHIPIVFDRAIRPEWFDFALMLLNVARSEREFRNALREHLQPLLLDATSLRKVVSTLQRTVGFRSAYPLEQLRADAARLSDTAPDRRVELRLGILVGTNPFLADCVSVLRRYELATGHPMSLAEVTARMQAQYGERGTVARRVRYALQTLVLCGGVEHIGRRWRLSSGTWDGILRA